MASRTPAATVSTIAGRPMSSGRMTSLIATPTDSRGSSEAGAEAGSTVAKTVACGLSTPSVPPDHTSGTPLTSSAVRVPLAASTSRNARSASSRV
jgi:hypothetical protein